MEHRNRMVMGLIGVALVVGFFLPWIDIGGLHSVSGYDIVRSGHISTLTRIILLLCPLGGAVLALAALARSPKTAQVSLFMGAGVLGYTTYKVGYYFLKLTGLGLWMVLGAGAVALIVGLAGRTSRS